VIVSSFEKFKRVASPGPLLLSQPCLVPQETVAGQLSTRIQMLTISDDTKTKDDAFVKYEVAIHYQLLFDDHDAVQAAWYSLEGHDIRPWLTSAIKSILRSCISGVRLDEAFLSKSMIQDAVVNGIQKGDEAVGRDPLKRFGYKLLNALVTDLQPVFKIREEMNNIYVQSCQKLANIQISESKKVMDVIHASALAERQRLNGEGTALMRRAIAVGLSDSTDAFCKDLNSIDKNYTYTAEDVVYLQLLMQQFDAFKLIGMSQHSAIAVPMGMSVIPQMISHLNFGAPTKEGMDRNVRDGASRSPRR
jgi:regulator of protease activity HflC (stomatin/prohibitin superfamily)